MTDTEPDVVVEQTADIPKDEDPEEYVERVQDAREAEAGRAHDEENLARARSGRSSLEEEEEAEAKAAKDAEAAAKKRESEAKKADDK